MQGQSSGVHTFKSFPASVSAFFSGREYTEKDLPRFIEDSTGKRLPFVKVRQVHGPRILNVSARNIPSAEEQADGLITCEPGLPLVIQTADCIPAFYWNPKKRLIGLAHAGWRGLQQGILREMTEAMSHEFGTRPGDLVVALGPFIRSCCYEVGSEFQEYFPGFYKPESDKKGKMDMAAAALDQLAAAGVPVTAVTDCGICTACQSASFYSVRKGAGDDRIYSVMAFE